MQNDRIQLPPWLNQGDCIGLFSPSGPIRDQEKFESGVRILHELGFKTRHYPVDESPHEYLAAADIHRSEEFHSLWEDSEVNVMMAVRGGYGCLRMMPYLNLDVLRKHPKLVIGFSDLTVLLNTLADRVGIASLHGPVVTSLAGMDKESLESFLSLAGGDITGQKVYQNVKILRDGTASGIIRGGNMTTIAHLLSTPWEIPLKNTLLILEDTGEPMYKIDRMLTQLYVSGRLEKLAGLLLGTFDCGTEIDSNLHLQEDIWNRVLELTVNMDFPIWGNFPVGHLNINHALPIGVSATMDSQKLTISIDCNNNNIPTG